MSEVLQVIASALIFSYIVGPVALALWAVCFVVPSVFPRPPWLASGLSSIFVFSSRKYVITLGGLIAYGQYLHSRLDADAAAALYPVSLAYAANYLQGWRLLFLLAVIYVVATVILKDRRVGGGPMSARVYNALSSFTHNWRSFTRLPSGTAWPSNHATNLKNLQVYALESVRAAELLNEALTVTTVEEVGMPNAYAPKLLVKDVRLAADIVSHVLTYRAPEVGPAEVAEGAEGAAEVECELLGQAQQVLAATAQRLAPSDMAATMGRAGTADVTKYEAWVCSTVVGPCVLLSSSAVALHRLSLGHRRGGFAPQERPEAATLRRRLLFALTEPQLLASLAAAITALRGAVSREPNATAAGRRALAVYPHSALWTCLAHSSRFVHCMLRCMLCLCEQERDEGPEQQRPQGGDAGDDEEGDDGEGDEEEEEVAGALSEGSQRLAAALESSGLLEALCGAMLAPLPPAMLKAEEVGQWTSSAPTANDLTRKEAVLVNSFVYATSNLANALTMLPNMATVLPRLAAARAAAAQAARAAATLSRPYRRREGASVVEATATAQRAARLVLGSGAQRLMRCLLERFVLDALRKEKERDVSDSDEEEESDRKRSGGGGRGGKGGGGSCGWPLLDAYRMHDRLALHMQMMDAAVVTASIDESGSADGSRLTMLEPALVSWSSHALGLTGTPAAGGGGRAGGQAAAEAAAEAALPLPAAIFKSASRAMQALYGVLCAEHPPHSMPTGSKYVTSIMSATSAVAGAHRRLPQGSAAARAAAPVALVALAWTLAAAARSIGMESDDDDDEDGGGGGSGGAGSDMTLRPLSYALQVFRHVADGFGEGLRRLTPAEHTDLARRLAAARWLRSVEHALRLGTLALVRGSSGSGGGAVGVGGAGGGGAEVVRAVLSLVPTIALFVSTPPVRGAAGGGGGAAAGDAQGAIDAAAYDAAGLLATVGKLASWLGVQLEEHGGKAGGSVVLKDDGSGNDSDGDEGGDGDGGGGGGAPRTKGKREEGSGEAPALFDSVAGAVWQLLGTGAFGPLGVDASSAGSGAPPLPSVATLALEMSAKAAAEVRGAVAFCLRCLCRGAGARAHAACALPLGPEAAAAAVAQRQAALGAATVCANWMVSPLAVWLVLPRDLLPARPERLLSGCCLLLGRCMGDGGREGSRDSLAGGARAVVGTLLALAATEPLSGDVRAWLLGRGVNGRPGGDGTEWASSLMAGITALSFVLQRCTLHADMEFLARLRAAAAQKGLPSTTPQQPGQDGGEAPAAAAAGSSAAEGPAAARAGRGGGGGGGRGRGSGNTSSSGGRGARGGAGGGSSATAGGSFCGLAQQLLKEWRVMAMRPAPPALPQSVATAEGVAGWVVLPRACASPRCDNFTAEAEAELEPKQCSSCRAARYCRPLCQREHWRQGHKEECGRG